MATLAGSLTVARPVLQDPNFLQTVVLILRHNDEGAFGLVVNRPAQTEGLPFPVYVGGPCPASGLILLHGHSDWTSTEGDEEPGEVAPGVYIGDADCMKRITELPDGETARFRIFANYSGWGPDQLERELSAGAWIVVPANAQLVFDTPADDLWDRLSPPAIPRPSDN